MQCEKRISLRIMHFKLKEKLFWELNSLILTYRQTGEDLCHLFGTVLSIIKLILKRMFST